jgi:hypothetical protein
LSTPLAVALAVAILLFFVALWLLITTLLAGLSGWLGLARRFPDRVEVPRIALKGQSGAMGMGVQLRGILTLSACPSGLRVAIWRAFAPFSKPFFVPWDEIEARPKGGLFVDLMRLGFGQPEAGAMTITTRTWQRLSTPEGQGRAEDR